MAQDISMTEINTASNQDSRIGADVVVTVDGKPYIDIQALTGTTETDIANINVIPSLHSLRTLSGKAQTTINSNLADGEAPLTSFPTITYGTTTPDGS